MEKDKIKTLQSFYGGQAVKIKNPLLTLRNVAKSYTKDGLFSNIDLTINSGDRITIAGTNGIGKSTLIKIILELEEEDEGDVVKNKELKIGYLPQETHWKSLENTIAEEINSISLTGAQKNQHKTKGLIERLLEDFGLPRKDWQRKITTLSGGERTKLALSKILVSGPNLLVLDEPTNHLDLETIEWLEQFLLKWGGAIICVSHDRYFLDKVCNKTFELTKSGLDKYYCPYSKYLIEKEDRIEGQEKKHSQQQRYFKAQQVSIDRFRAKASKAKGVKSKIKQLAKIERVKKVEKSKNIRIKFNIERKTCTKVLEINNLTIGKEESFLFKISKKIEVDWGDKIGIIGNNGTGKSTLLKSILSEYENKASKVKIGAGIEIGYYAQAHEDLNPEKNILEEVLFKTMVSEEKVRNVLGCLLFSQDKILKKIDYLSGGERARVSLTKLILQKSNFLLLDEPTNHLDLPSKEVVTNMLKDFEGTILLISHDRYILNKVCNIIWEVKNKELNRHPGNYEDYRYHIKQSKSSA